MFPRVSESAFLVLLTLNGRCPNNMCNLLECRNYWMELCMFSSATDIDNQLVNLLQGFKISFKHGQLMEDYKSDHPLLGSLYITGS